MKIKTGVWQLSRGALASEKVCATTQYPNAGLIERFITDDPFRGTTQVQINRAEMDNVESRASML